MKLSIIQNVYKENPYIRETTQLNLLALKDSGIDYQYIVFNDNGDESIKNQVADLDVEYFYSEINYGKKMCMGGWIGAIPLLKGDLVHSTGQDDIFTSQFYRETIDHFLKFDCDIVYSNGFFVNENLTVMGNLLGPLEGGWNYENPRQVFNAWFGVNDQNKITRANNYIGGPATVYKKSLHDQIGPPEINTFFGTSDFEYWARALYYGKKIKYIPFPNWLYRRSAYSAGLEIIDGKQNESEIAPLLLEKIKEKYQALLDKER